MRKQVLIVSDDSEFVNSLVQNWHASPCAPEFVVSGIGKRGNDGQASVAVLDGSEGLSCFSGEVSLAIVVTGDRPLPKVCGSVGRLLQIRRSDGWAELAVALAQESLLYANALERMAELERRLIHSERLAALGQFIVEARHGLGNALTSVLGNSELLLESELGLREQVRGQLETIHAMSLKIYETMQGFSSLNMEMQAAERESLSKVAGAAASQ